MRKAFLEGSRFVWDDGKGRTERTPGENRKTDDGESGENHNTSILRQENRLIKECVIDEIERGGSVEKALENLQVDEYF